MNIKLLLLAAFITFNFFARAQNTSGLQGSVSNELSAPLEGASITILNTNFSTFTSEDGDFQFVDIPYGDYVIQVSAAGYASIHREVQLPADSRLDLQLSRAADQLDAVTVTAQKREENLQRVPLSISTLPARKVEEYHLWNGKDLAAIVPNLYAANPGDNRNVVSIRGIATTSYDPAVVTYIDGVSQFGLDTYIAQLLDIERIEVLRGPQGTLYGRNAMGGVINIITRQPGNTSSGYVRADIGNYGLQRYGFGLRTALVENRLFLGAAGMYDQTDGYYTNVFDDSDYDQAQSFMGNYYLKYLASSRWSLTLNVKHDQNRNQGAFPLVSSPEEALENPFDVNQNAVTDLVDKVFNASLSANYYGEAVNFSSQTAWQSNHRYYTQPIDGDFSPADIYSIINNYGRDWNNVKVLTQEFRFSSTGSDDSPFEWTAGLYGFYQDNPVRQGTHLGKDVEFADMDPSMANTTTITTNEGSGFGVAVYGQGTYRLTEKLAITAGLRYDHEEKELSVKGEFLQGEQPPMIIQPDTAADAGFNAFSPKLSLAYDLSERHHTYLTYSRGFRAGGITQYSGQPNQPPLYSYEPEYSNNFEAGIKNMLAGGKLRLNFSAFYMKVTDAQVPTLVLPQAITITRNVGELESKGLEMEVAATPLKGLEAAWNFGYTDAVYTSLQVPGEEGTLNLDGNRQLFTPNATSMLSLQYTYTPPSHPGIQLIAGGQWQYTGSQYFDLKNTIEQAGYYLFHARAGVATGKFEVFAWGRNILDKTYIDYAYDFRAAHLGDPGTFGVSVTARL
ncbi:iron complex outermembrane receptor protein [Anseongella ginsenosidimutans]|uniref:Iron complex outermembrane receptor protein n=1 Tax=Anseongella ginsenosidimutans TaxID=496056 RepID=A0A4V6NZ49_9SPHI|nr:TonB-dependent receptor [Anseongella ginsenosidimutans]TCS89183.1 iron complex outermembrane receptor protein [Anseongella ginsenosidimutans]